MIEQRDYPDNIATDGIPPVSTNTIAIPEEQEGLMTKLKVLIVDEDTDDLSLCKRAFEAQGYEVETATNRRDAFLLIQEGGLDAVITEVKLPESTTGGLHIFQTLQSMYLKTPEEAPPVIFHTDYSSERILSVVRSASFYSEVLTKSRDSPKKLVALVEEVLGVEEALESEQETQKEQNPYAESQILFVEDSLALGHYTLAFKDLGYNNLKTASNETDAYSLIEQGGLDVVVVDLKLSGSYFVGLHVLQKVKQINPDTQVIFYTDDDDLGVVSLAERLGAYAVITQSEGLQKLKDTVAEALSQKRQKDLALFSDAETMRRITEKVEGPGEATRRFVSDGSKRELVCKSL